MFLSFPFQIGPNEVCGCPFDPLFPSINKECRHFCEHPRKTCIKHYCWEKLRRAEIDQEKLNLVREGEGEGESPAALAEPTLDTKHSPLTIACVSLCATYFLLLKQVISSATV